MKLAYKIWIDHHGKAFGDGPWELLKGVQNTKSLHRAALQMGMSYNKAWHLMSAIEKKLGFALIERKAGGLSGGGSRITPEAIRLMKRYERFRKEATKALENIFRNHFGEGQ